MTGTAHTPGRRRLAAMALAVLLPLLAASPAAAADAAANACSRCHGTPAVTDILHTTHGQAADPRTPFAGEACQACHGPSTDHMARPAAGARRAPPDISFGPRAATPAAVQSQTCLACHGDTTLLNWHVGDHAAADVSCASCHSLHTAEDAVLSARGQAETCYGCHTEQRAQAAMRSRHPIREGLVSCGDCHNPHGASAPAMLTEPTVNGTCFQCHADLRGPFLWEHSPVVDGCDNCHSAHGSVHAGMLRMRAPFLCQSCHAEARHPSTLYSGRQLPGAAPSDRLLARNCLNCHTRVHGSNHPSGTALTR